MKILDEIIRRDGLQDYNEPPACAHCLENIGTFRCLDCVQVTLYCSPCIVQRHEHQPLHRIEVRSNSTSPPPPPGEYLLIVDPKVWRDGFYQRTTLLELGFHFYIGHQHTPCPSTDAFQPILVIHSNGADYVNVQFCACEEAPSWVEHYRQLLRIGWYPASFDRPKTVFTFDLLDTYHKLTLQGKLNLYDFYLSTMQKTDNCGRKKTIVSLTVTVSDIRTSDLYASASVS